MANFEISGYELYELLGRGGMATVYRALHLNLDREVAIKVMDTSLNTDATFSERFVREARISARLVHPHILQIYDVNSYGVLNYISMELLEGGDLSDSIRGSMTQATIYGVMEQMTEALDYAASKGYVHRDIKPSNIMLRDENDYVLADFGIAKSSDSGTQMTQTGLMVGTPSYMSPEQAKGIVIDGRSDLYSLGVLCFEMLTKELPYDSDSAVSTAVKHLTEDIPKLPEHLLAYQPFVDKALAKNAAARYQTGREMFRGFCELRSQFSEDEILTEGKVQPETKRTGADDPDDSRTSIAWDDSTQVLAPSRPSRPYKLSDTAQREPLVSGIRSGARPIRRETSAFGSAGFRVFAGAVVVGALGFGGYTYWQGQQNATSVDLRALTSELAQAYGALNNDDFERAAIAFRKVLDIDGNHAAALQGLSEVEVSYVAAIDEALESGQIAVAKKLFLEYSLIFPDTASTDRLQAALDLADQEQQLVSVQSDRVDILLDKADKAIEVGKLFEPVGDNGYEYIRQVLALDNNNSAAHEGFDVLLSTSLERVAAYVADRQFGDARDLLNQVSLINPDLSVLAREHARVDLAQETELQRQKRWTGYSEERQQAILERLALAEDFLAKGILTPSEEKAVGENARDAFLLVLELDPENASAQDGPMRIAMSYISRAEKAAAKEQFDEAASFLAGAGEVAPDFPKLRQEQEMLLAAREAYAERAVFQAQVDEILALAGDELARLDEGSGQPEEAVRLYRDVLRKDPVNEAALAGITHVTEYYVTRANEAVAYGEFTMAAEALNAALVLAPDRGDIATLLSGLPEKESQWVTDQNVNLLMDSGDQLATEGDYRGAGEKYDTAIKLEAGNERARESLGSVVESLFDRAKASIKSGDFTGAGEDLTDAITWAPEREDIAGLLAQLPDIEQAWNEEQQLARSLENARALLKKGQLSGAASAYAGVLESHPESAVAREGFNEAIRGLITSARTSVGKGDFATAEKTLATATELAPQESEVSALLADLPRLEQEWQQHQASAAREREMATALANTGMAAVANGDLDMAVDTYGQLALSHPDLGVTQRLKKELLFAYVVATREQIGKQEYAVAQEYLSRGQALAPNYAAWGKLEEEIEVSRASNRRRLGAY